MSVADLVQAVIDRIDNQLLVQLTNELASATTINTTRLTGACTDAVGEFEMTSGMLFNSNSGTHIAILIHGVLYFLELYKGREGAMLESHNKKFFNKCKSLRELAVVTPSTNSQAVASQESANSLPDMDRSRRVFSIPTSSAGIANSSTFSGDQ